ncbi:type 1 glutamine amidotransferase [Shimia sp. SDUM112013]|uniref:type 1 glutamine amidotransferase n=1 Tax=Shimia sp. SDUM112013 TaxID=3136160 RepID=UPI0032ED7F6B
MTTILIIESNTPDLLAIGKSAAASFVRTFQGIAPEVTLKIACPYAAPLNDDVFDGVDGVVFSGSGVMWSTADAQAAPLRAEMERAFERGRPVWGSCNGMQLAAVVLGGGVGESPNGFEIGAARDTRLSPDGAAHPMMAGRKDGFAVPCIHRDEVQALPEGAVLIAGNAHSPVQAMAYEVGGVDFWGTQYHPEMSMADVAASTGGRSLFDGARDLTDDLARADKDPNAAFRLGTSVEALALQERARELVNWLAHVRAKAVRA